MAGYDVIGDTHGYLAPLEALLALMGYRETRGAYRHPEGRIAVYVGDYVDRGPAQVGVVDRVRRMIEAGTALACLGNHEFNALCFGLEDPRAPGRHVRRRRGGHVTHHQSYLDQVGGADSALHREHLAFFATLPFWLDLGEVRVVHACWHQPSIDKLSEALGAEGRVGTTDRFVEIAIDPELFDAAEVVCKGIEVPLPEGIVFHDPQGVRRKRGRASWWVEAPTGFADVVGEPALRDLVAHLPTPVEALVPDDGGAPVVFGHYWMAGEPRLVTRRRASVDFSVAKGGPLVAYRHDGEQSLDPAKVVWVDQAD